MLVKSAKLSNYKIKKIIKCFIIDIDATKTSLIVNVNRNTVNRYFNLFRLLIYHKQQEEFKRIIKGTVELDESYFGGKRRRGYPGKRGRGTDKKPVFGIYEREKKVYTEIVPNCKKKILQKIILGKIDKNSTVVTDFWKGYSGLVDVGYGKHIRLNHKKGVWTDGKGHHINGIENFWSFCKRRLQKFNGINKNFPLHLKECEWRYKKSREQLYNELIVLLKKKKLL
jgi:transposase